MKFWSLLVVAFLLLVPSTLQASKCPEGYKCIPEEIAQKYFLALQEYKCMQDALEEGKIKVSFNPYRIVMDKEGRFYADEDIEGILEWCSYKIKLRHKPIVTYGEPPPEDPSTTWGFRLRVRMGMTITPYKDPSFMEMIDPALFLEPFHYEILHLSTHASLNSVGAGIGFDITRNLDMYVGVGVMWGSWKPAVVLGTSLSFN